MAEDREQIRSFSRRSMLVGAAQLLGFGIIGGRLYQLQVIDAERYRMLAEDNRVNLELLPPLRGRITDRFGTVLAGNRRTLGVVIVPEQTNGVEETLEELARIVPLTTERRASILKEVKRNRPFVPVTVTRDLNWHDFARVNVVSPDLPGVHGETGTRRIYPMGEAIAHMIGYVGPASEDDRFRDTDPLLGLSGFQIGRRGVERNFDKTLRGQAGNREVEVNAVGRVIRELDRREGLTGNDVVLTLDARLQTFAMNRLSGEVGAAVVMDVETGDIYASASTPSFDPNGFVGGLPKDRWDAIRNHPYAPLLNRSVAGRYPPGSTFKIAVLAAALEAGVIDPRKTIYCSGHIELGDRRFHCWHRRGHGHMDAVGAMRESCDIYFYEIARETGIDRIAEMATRLGLGTGFDLAIDGVRRGTVPTKAWKLAEFGRPWQVGETLVAGIGQGFVLSTPLELAVMTARIANGKKAVSPRIVRPIGPGPEPAIPELNIKPWVVRQVQRGLDEVVNHKRGTARSSRLERDDVQMAGKTGTAQVRRITKAERESGVLKNEDLEWLMRDHALFVAYAPTDKPRYAVSIVVEHGGSGSAAAAPVAKDILTEALRLDPANQTPVEGLPEQRIEPEGEAI